MPIRTERQTLLFSATLSHRVLELAYEHMNEPEKIVVETEFITAAKVRQKVYFPADDEKIPLLLGLLSRSEGARTMVFVNTKAFVERVARALERGGYRVGVLSGDVPQKKRESLLAKFQKGQLEILVATDVAARGLHIDGVSHVYNYDLPFDAEDYVHRIGRTARLGAEGDAISFACERYAMSLPDIEAYIEQKLPVATVEADLLVALPRTPRELPEGAEGERGREHRRDLQGSARAACGRRGASRWRTQPQWRRFRHRWPASQWRSQRRSLRRRPPRRRRAARRTQAASAARLRAAAAVGTGRCAAAAAIPGLADDAERAPRKRRRRRGGRRIEGNGEAAVAAAASTARARRPRCTRRSQVAGALASRSTSRACSTASAAASSR